MTKEELEKELVAAGHRIVENRLTDEELEEEKQRLMEMLKKKEEGGCTVKAPTRKRGRPMKRVKKKEGEEK